MQTIINNFDNPTPSNILEPKAKIINQSIKMEIFNVPSKTGKKPVQPTVRTELKGITEKL